MTLIVPRIHTNEVMMAEIAAFILICVFTTVSLVLYANLIFVFIAYSFVSLICQTGSERTSMSNFWQMLELRSIRITLFMCSENVIDDSNNYSAAEVSGRRC